MARVLIIAGLAAFAFTVYAVVDCALTERARLRGLPRWTWLLMIVVLPVVGGALWLLLGSGRLQGAPRTRPLGPDDDPDFLPQTGRSAAITAVDEDRWQRLEQELAEIDADSDDDGGTRRS